MKNGCPAESGVNLGHFGILSKPSRGLAFKPTFPRVVETSLVHFKPTCARECSECPKIFPKDTGSSTPRRNHFAFYAPLHAVLRLLRRPVRGVGGDPRDGGG